MKLEGRRPLLDFRIYAMAIVVFLNSGGAEAEQFNIVNQGDTFDLLEHEKTRIFAFEQRYYAIDLYLDVPSYDDSVRKVGKAVHKFLSFDVNTKGGVTSQAIFEHVKERVRFTGIKGAVKYQNVFEKTKKLALIIVEGQEKVDFEDNGAIVVFRGKRAIGGIAIAVGAMGAGVGITAIAGGVGIYVSHKDLQTKIDWLNQRLDRLERTDLLHTMTMINVSETIGKQSHFITNEYDQLTEIADLLSLSSLTKHMEDGLLISSEELIHACNELEKKGRLIYEILEEAKRGRVHPELYLLSEVENSLKLLGEIMSAKGSTVLLESEEDFYKLQASLLYSEERQDLFVRVFVPVAQDVNLGKMVKFDTGVVLKNEVPHIATLSHNMLAMTSKPNAQGSTVFTTFHSSSIEEEEISCNSKYCITGNPISFRTDVALKFDRVYVNPSLCLLGLYFNLYDKVGSYCEFQLLATPEMFAGVDRSSFVYWTNSSIKLEVTCEGNFKSLTLDIQARKNTLIHVAPGCVLENSLYRFHSSSLDESTPVLKLDYKKLPEFREAKDIIKTDSFWNRQASKTANIASTRNETREEKFAETKFAMGPELIQKILLDTANPPEKEEPNPIIGFFQNPWVQAVTASVALLVAFLVMLCCCYCCCTCKANLEKKKSNVKLLNKKGLNMDAEQARIEAETQMFKMQQQQQQMHQQRLASCANDFHRSRPPMGNSRCPSCDQPVGSAARSGGSAVFYDREEGIGYYDTQ